MKVTQFARISLTAVLFVSILSLNHTVQAQAVQTKHPVKGTKAYSIPISHTRLTFTVTVNSTSSNIMVEEGGMAKFANFQGGFGYALVPVVSGTDSNAADFAIYRLTQDKGGNESLKILEHVTAGVGETVVSNKSYPGVSIKLTSIVVPAKSSAAKPFKLRENKIQIAFAPASAKEDCCVHLRVHSVVWRVRL